MDRDGATGANGADAANGANGPHQAPGSGAAVAPASGPPSRQLFVLTRPGLDELVGALRRRGFTVIGPAVQSQAIVLRESASSGPRRLSSSAR